MVTLTKRTLRTALGLDNDAALARWFEISHAAVSQWPLDEAIPEKRAMQAALRRPDLFAPPHGAEPDARAG